MLLNWISFFHSWVGSHESEKEAAAPPSSRERMRVFMMLYFLILYLSYSLQTNAIYSHLIKLYIYLLQL